MATTLPASTAALSSTSLAIAEAEWTRLTHGPEAATLAGLRRAWPGPNDDGRVVPVPAFGPGATPAGPNQSAASGGAPTMSSARHNHTTTQRLTAAQSSDDIDDGPHSTSSSPNEQGSSPTESSGSNGTGSKSSTAQDLPPLRREPELLKTAASQGELQLLQHAFDLWAQGTPLDAMLAMYRLADHRLSVAALAMVSLRQLLLNHPTLTFDLVSLVNSLATAPSLAAFLPLQLESAILEQLANPELFVWLDRTFPVQGKEQEKHATPGASLLEIVRAYLGACQTSSAGVAHASRLRTLAQRHAYAQALLGFSLFQGMQHFPKREDEACRLFSLSSEQGLLHSRFNLAVCLFHGLGTTMDQAKAEELFASAAEAGHPSAMVNYALILQKRSPGLPSTQEQVLRLLTRASCFGLPQAQYQLGIHLLRNREPSTRTQALTLLQNASLQKFATAQEALRCINERARKRPAQAAASSAAESALSGPPTDTNGAPSSKRSNSDSGGTVAGGGGSSSSSSSNGSDGNGDGNGNGNGGGGGGGGHSHFHQHRGNTGSAGGGSSSGGGGGVSRRGSGSGSTGASASGRQPIPPPTSRPLVAASASMSLLPTTPTVRAPPALFGGGLQLVSMPGAEASGSAAAGGSGSGPHGGSAAPAVHGMMMAPNISREQFAMHLLQALATVGASLDSLVPNLTTFQQHMSLCASGNPHSMFIVGLCCLCERFGMHDATRGVEYLASSASRAHSWAAWILSLCYRAGVGVPQNAALAQLYEAMATDATTNRAALLTPS